MNDAETRPRLHLAWRIVIFLLGFGAIQVLLAAGVGIVGAIYFAATRSGETRSDELDQMASWLQTPEVLVKVAVLLAIPTVVLALGWVALCRKVFDRRPLMALGLGRPAWGWGKTFGLGSLAGATPIIVCVVLLWGLGGLRPSGVTTSVLTGLLVPALLLLAFHEELVFRGYLLRNFLEAERPVLGVALTSLLFAMLHGFNPDVWSSPVGPVNLVGAGVVLALAYLASDELWFPTVLHFAWNLAQGVLFELPVSGLTTDGVVDVELTGELPVWLTGGGFGLESSVLMTGAEIVLAAVFLRLWRRRREVAESAAEEG